MCAMTARISEHDNLVFMFAILCMMVTKEQSHVHETCIATAMTAMTTKITMKAWMNMHQSQGMTADQWMSMDGGLVSPMSNRCFEYCRQFTKRYSALNDDRKL